MPIPLLSRPIRFGLTALSLLLSLWLLAAPARASHIRAGDIQAKSDTTAARNPLRFFFRMITYTDPTTGAHNDPDETIFFGDGTSAVVLRRSQVGIGNNVFRNVYVFEHTYPGPGRYFVSHLGENRANNIRNVPNSGARSFYIHTMINISPTLGRNQAPVLNAPAVDRAASGQVFLHNPAASDADGDSLAFKLRVCQHDQRSILNIVATNNRPAPTDLPGYSFPQVSSGGLQVPYAGPPADQPGQASILNLNPNSGQMVWNAPNLPGDYNVAFTVEEWRRRAGAPAVQIGEVVRDMQITVVNSANNRPTVFVPNDTCVVAGTSLVRTIRATDSDNNFIRLTAFAGIIPPATFAQTVSQPGLALGRFTWNTRCEDVAAEPKIIVFRAEDQPNFGSPLVDLRPWRVTVVGPPPTNLSATPTGNAVQLNWDRYFCQTASRILIFRKENSSIWTPSPCETGIPASAGYTQIGAVAANLQTFADNNTGSGLERGRTYCYRIYAEFPLPGGGASIASQEVCVTLPGRSVLFTNVTVESTDASTGQIRVRWTRPAPLASFTTAAGYRLYRGTGPAAPTTLVRTFTGLNDTVHLDTNLDTRNQAYTYRLEFFRANPQTGGAEIVEPAGPASSVRVEATPNPGLQPSMEVRWTHNVPWNNSGARTRIYRQDPGGNFRLLTSAAPGTRTGGTYLDQDPALRINQTYCYYVETVGGYDSPRQPQDLVNQSQRQCVLLAQPPCRPVLALQGPDCEDLEAQARQSPSPLTRPLTFENNLSWTMGNQPAGCNPRVVEFRVLYSPECDSTAFQEIGRVSSAPPTNRTYTFRHAGLASAAGCYRIQAIDSLGSASASNIVQGENCRIFVLPNVFTPNNDRQNDTFRPIFASPVHNVRVQVYNRWGARVYQGTTGSDPTLWDGGGARGRESAGQDTGAKATAGTYYYLVEVEFADFNRTRQTYKGWVEVVR